MTDNKKTPKSSVPAWGWLFVAACVLIPVLTLGGAIPGAIGGAGAFGCADVSRDVAKSSSTRVLICCAVTFVCWLVFLVFLGGVVVIQSKFRS